jgi:hypothetical protein
VATRSISAKISIRRFDNFKPVVFDQFLAAGVSLIFTKRTESRSSKQRSTTKFVGVF